MLKMMFSLLVAGLITLLLNINAEEKLGKSMSNIIEPKENSKRLNHCTETFADNTTDFNLMGVLDQILCGYDSRVRPKFQNLKNNTPVRVGVSLHVPSVSTISEVDMDYTLEMYFRQRWHDERLAFKHLLINKQIGDEDVTISVSENLLNRIWWPDTFFANAKSAQFHQATTRNAFLRIDSQGHIQHSLRLTVTAACPMDLTYFPMDTQICRLEIESFGYTVQDIVYEWVKKDPVGWNSELRLPQYELKSHELFDMLANTSTGSYSRLSIAFKFKRSVGYYLIQIYLPSLLIVVISWISFWLRRDAVPARVALGITTVLTMTTLISSTNASLPKISYLKAIDVFLVTCFIMVFASLLEYAAVGYLSTKNEKMNLIRSRRYSSNPDIELQDYFEHEAELRVKKLDAGPNQKVLRCNGRSRLETSRDESQVWVNEINYKTVDEDNANNINVWHKFQSNDCVKCDHCGSFVHENQIKSQINPDKKKSINRNYTHRQPVCEYNARGIGNNLIKLLIRRPGLIDQYSRILFPIIFVIFNLIYWITYSILSSLEDKIANN